MKIIGMIHLKTLPGYPQHKNMEIVINQAVEDAKLLLAGRVDAILIENTDDDPHQKEVSPEITSAFTIVAQEVKNIIGELPLGICVLWNDYKSSLAIAKVVGAQFVRIPVFTEAVVTASGLIEANPYEIISYRKRIEAEEIKIFADVQVKHAAMLAKRPLQESASEALHFGADGIIITGRYTGDAPVIEDLKLVREHCPKATIIIGSGTTPENVNKFGKYANQAIIGTFFKPNGMINVEKIKLIMAANNSYEHLKETKTSE